MRILVVDDEAHSRQLLVDILSKEGYQVDAADGGELALVSLSLRRADLILVDIRMPGMDGFEVCRRLQDREETRKIPLMFLSATTDTKERVEGLRLGAVDFVPKPFQRDELLARVRTHLELGMLRSNLELEVAKRTAELRESEVRFRHIADAAPVMIWVSGIDKRCTFVSRGWLEFTGREEAQELGDGWTQNIHPSDVGRCLTAYTGAFDERRPFETEYRLRRADGEYRWVFDRGVPYYSPDGAFVGYVGSVLDITDLKESHQQMIAAQKLESLGVMAAGVAHDFGNVLASICGEADLALSEMPVQSPGRESARNILDLVMNAREIVNMLSASAGGAADSIVWEPVDLSGLVEQTLRLLKVSISKKAAIGSALAEGLPAVRGNVGQIRQVVLNLVTNASEALAGRKGSIIISTESVCLGPGYESNRFANLPDGRYVRLKVTDTGCGITPEHRSKIFDQFFTTKSLGRGLGLAAVHGIVRSHGGAINVVSTPGAGSSFEVLFPCMSQTLSVMTTVG